MKITNYAIKNYQFTLIIVLMIVALGVSGILKMPRAEDPAMHAPSYPITVIYPGTSPEDMEKLVVKPIEKKIFELSGIKQVRTSISSGLAVFMVEYEYNENVDDKYGELTREINSLRGELPQDIYSIEVSKISPSDVNVIQIALVSENASRNQLNNYAAQLQSDLEKITALKNVEVNGLPDQIVRINLRLDKLSELKLPIDQIAGIIRSELTNIPGGIINEGTKAFNVKTDGNIQSIEQLKNIVLTGATHGDLRLSDVADVYFDYAAPKHLMRLNGHRSVAVVAALKEGRNITDVQKEYLSVIHSFKTTLPANIDMVFHFDQATNVNHRLAGLGRDFLIAIGLVLLTLLPLGTRASFVVMLAIPLSLGVGIIMLNLLGYSLNQLSIVGFVVALGLLVDDSIVVVENIERWMREGYSRLEATIKGTGQIAVAVIGCTATLIIAFMPLLFLPEASGEFIRSLPVSIIGTIIGSLLVALTIVPFYASKILKPAESEHGNVFLQWLQAAIHKTYGPLLDKSLKYPAITLLIAAAIFTGALFLIPVIGTSLFPSSEKPQFLVDVSAPLQSNIYYTDSITRSLEKDLKEDSRVRYFTTNVGKGNPRIYYNVFPKEESSDFAEIFVQLQPDTKAGEKKQIIDAFRKKWASFPGAKVQVKDFEQGTPMAAPVEVRVLGENLDTLRMLAGKVQDLMESVDGTIYVNNDVKNLKSDIRVNIDKEKAISLGVSSANIGQAVRMAVAGLNIGKFTNPDAGRDDYDIVLTTDRLAYPNLRLFDHLYVNSATGSSVPIRQIATIGLESSPMTITHLNKVRRVSVTSFVKNGYLSDRVISNVIHQVETIDMPDGYHYEMGGEVEGRSESFHGFENIILVASFLFIAVLVLQFRTFKSTIIVLSVIPLGIVGAVAALLVTGHSLSFVATIGIVALAGIEVKNTILQVDFTNELREQGMPLIEAVEKAGEARFLPIILTTLTAIGGLTPIALSSNPLISPLAIVMIGGLISSTLLSRIVTPVVYMLIPPKIEIEKPD